MADQPLRYELELAGHTLHVRQVRGSEALSAPFRFEVSLTLPEGVELDPHAAVKQQASLLLVRAGVRRRIDGIASEVFVGGTVGGQADLELVIEPRFALARFRSNVKVFRDKSATDIIAEVLSELGVSFEIRGASCSPRPYTVQYQETDFHFVSRLLEAEGLFYYFAPGDVMIIGGSAAAYENVGTVLCRQPSGVSQHEESVWALGTRSQTSVGNVSLRDWNPETPSVPMDVAAAGPTGGGPEYYDYPGGYTDPGQGQRIADVTAAAFQCAATGIAGRGNVAALGAGNSFSVAGGPAGSPTGSFALTRVQHDFHRERGDFEVTFDGIDGGTVYRPTRAHDAPRLTGPLIGVVTGPPGEDIHTDELGRVKVHFKWDRLQPLDDTCSHWISVLQDNAGHSVCIPRVGWEVLVHFVEGDPDRPVVLGRVYNAIDPFPVVLPANKTQTALKSLSTPTRDGSNEIVMDDLAGKQRVAIHAEKDQEIIVALDKAERIEAKELVAIGRDEAVAVAMDEHVAVGGSALLSIDGAQQIVTAGDVTREVEGDESITVSGNHALSVGDRHQRRVSGSDSVKAGSLRQSIGVALLETSVRSNSITAAYGIATTVGGAVLEAARKDKTESADLARTETIGGLVLTKAKDAISFDVKKKRVTTVGGALKITAAQRLTVDGGKSLSMVSMAQQHSASFISVEVGKTRVTITPDQLEVAAAKTIKFTVDGDCLLETEKSTQN